MMFDQCRGALRILLVQVEGRGLEGGKESCW